VRGNNISLRGWSEKRKHLEMGLTTISGEIDFTNLVNGRPFVLTVLVRLFGMTPLFQKSDYCGAPESGAPGFKTS
jgi:hypothetical protein